LEHLSLRGDNNKTSLKQIVWEKLESSDSGYGEMAGYYEHRNELRVA